MNTRHTIRTTALAAAIAAIAATATLAPAQETEIFDTHVLQEALMLEPLGELGMKTRVDLILTGPEGFYQRQRFDAGELVEFDPSTVTTEAMPDGVYKYEVRIMDVAGLNSSRETGEIESIDPGLQDLSGAFSIRDGQIVDPNLREAPPKKSSQGLTSTGAGTDAQPSQGLQDQVILDDLIVDGSACIGFDCVDGESFGFDTIRMKENNLRIKFEDTSSSASFPTTDWELIANESANGGLSHFSIQDVDAGRRIFTVEANAPSNSLYIDSGGRVGFGTSNPVLENHIVDGDTPTVRLEQDGSSGFSPQTWDIAGNETNFFIRDVSNGSLLPFRIRPGAPTSSIDIAASGNVGIGTSAPENRLHISASDGSANLLLEETQSIATNSMLRMRHNGNPGFLMENTDTSVAWEFRLGGSGSSEQFLVNKTGVPGPELSVFANGDIRIKGSYLNSSSRTTKQDIVKIDTFEILERLNTLSVYEWSYKQSPNVRHVGPMAEDYYELFGLAGNGNSLAAADLAGISLASIQALHAEVRSLKKRNKKLEAQNAAIENKLEHFEDLEARLVTLESRITRLSGIAKANIK